MTPYTTAKNVVQKISQNGYIAYFAGGFVRDKILDHPSDDIDIATDAPVSEIVKIFDKTIPVGINFGIVIVVEDGHHFEVASFRKESGYKDGRRPDHVERATPEEDAQRRDFTINGMFFDPISNQLYDYVSGKEDLKKKIIRAIGDPHERFMEDRLRMIRAVRYAARFHFSIEQKTIDAIIAHADSLFPAVAIERVVQEFKKMAAFANFSLALVKLHKYRLLEQIFPSLASLTTEEIEERLKHLPQFPKDAPLISKLLELFDEIPPKICDQLKLSNEERKYIEEYVLWEDSSSFDDYELVGMYAKPHALTCLEILTLKKKDPDFKAFHQEKMKLHQSAIDRMRKGITIVVSSHLIERGVKPGIQLGILLKDAEKIAINHHLEKPEEILKLLPL